ncbi:YfhO family protein, partial [bacterium]|nr:YfhO family protein [bacterium]
YKNKKVNVTVRFNKDLVCSSFGLFSLDVNKLHKLCNEAKGADLNIKGSGLYGKCTADEDSTLFLSLPYSDNFTVKVNGKKVPYKRAFTGFTAFDIPKGESEISITFLPKGFIAGATISLIGIFLTALCFKFKDTIDGNTKINGVCRVVLMGICIAVVTYVYIFSVLAKVLMLAGIM